MNIKNKFLILFTVLLLFSCSTKKNILYVQDLSENTEFSFDYQDYRIKVDDILKISIEVENPEAKVMFNNFSPSNQNETRESLIFKGFQVNSEGFIFYPRLGKVYVKGLTASNLSEKIYKEIIEKGLLTAFSIDVKVINLDFTILGEVNTPGRYFFSKNNLNIFEAIGMAGDLTINGQRKNVKLIREINGNKKVFDVDLTSSKIFNSKIFQIIPGDIIIVNPNLNKVKNAGIIGNSGTLLSLLSFILSLIIVTSQG